ncbi:MAG: hypothetical protein SF070_03695 [Gemmatimonadota bacterium]|nr:hypothetical protein [Gemmatimonadota bacterium]
MARGAGQCGPRHFIGSRRGVGQPGRHGLGHFIRGAAADRIVEVALHHLPPGVAQDGALSPRGEERRQRLRDAGQPQLDETAAPLERGPGAVHPLQGPGVAVGPAQVAGQERQVLEVAAGGAEVGRQARGAELHLRVNLPQPRGKASEIGIGGVVVGADKQRHVPGGGAGEEARLHRRPRGAEPGVRHQEVGADLVAVRREMIHQHPSPVGAFPPGQVVAAGCVIAQAAPEHRVGEPRFRGQGGEHRGMTEGVRRVEHPAVRGVERLLVPGADQQVAEQRLPRRNLLVGQDVPGAGNQPAGPHQGRHPLPLLGPDDEVVLEQNGLAIEQEGGEARVGIELGQQAVQQRDQPGAQRAERQVPLAVPVGMGDDVNDGARHHRILPRAFRRGDPTAGPGPVPHFPHLLAAG